MKDECIICKSRSDKTKPLNKETIYKRYRSHEFLLCYKHSVEFFKLGQEQFILKYTSVARENEWHDEGHSKKIAMYF